MKIFSLWISLFLLASSCATKAVIDETYTATDPEFTKVYSHAPAKCVKESAHSLREMGIPIEKQGASEIITDRYDALQIQRTSGRVSGTGSVHGQTIVSNQRVKATLSILKNGQGCSVRVARVRAWENNVEFDTLNVGFTKKMFVEPFFKNLAEFLK